MPQPRVRATLSATTMGLLSALALPTSAAAAPDVTSRAPDAADYAAITHAFRTDRRIVPAFRRHGRIVEIRETAGGPPVARVLFTGGGARASSLGRAAFTAFYFKPTGEWQPDPKVSAKLARALHTIPTAWDVRYTGSGTETKRGSSPGETGDNPWCQVPASTEQATSRFGFHASWRLDVNGVDTPGVGTVTGTGTEQFDEQDGCIYDTTPIAPHSTHCSATFKGDLLTGNFHSQISAQVDSRGNHELRLRLPITQKDPVTCGAPEVWEHSGDGPIAYEHSVLVPDAALARGAAFRQSVGSDEDVFEACLRNGPMSRCSSHLSWTGTISFKPARLPTLHEMRFEGQAPDASAPAAGNADGRD